MTETWLRGNIAFFTAGAVVRLGGVATEAAELLKWCRTGLPNRTIATIVRSISSSAATALTAIVARRQGRIRSWACSIARIEFGLPGSAPSRPRRRLGGAVQRV